MRRTLNFFCFLMLCLAWGSGATTQTATQDPQAATAKLGVFLGKWETEASFMGSKATSVLECRWSPKGSFLVCEQIVSLAQGKQTQLTIYAYNPKDGNYTFSTFSNPGQPPSTGSLTIKDNVWTYAFSFDNNGKTVMLRTTNEFTAPGEEIFKTERSEDGGAHWTVFLEGKGHRIAAP